MAWSKVDSASTACLGLLFVWSYWPALKEVIAAWDRTEDYSHGYLVAPVAAMFLWMRRDSFPGLSAPGRWIGLVVVAAAVLMRTAGAIAYINMAEAWSILLWAAGAMCAVAGWRALRWAMPSILFLAFMIPLPYRAETFLSVPLQSISTRVSCWILQSLWQPAISLGNVIYVDETPFQVAEACSGIRIFVSIFALAYVYVVFVRTNIWTRLGVLSSILPIAILSNSLRIVATVLLSRLVSSEAASRFSHDLAGWVTIPVAAAFFWGVTSYLGRLFVEMKLATSRELFAE